MKPVSFRLHGWESWAPHDNAEKAIAIPTLLRRRITPIGQKALNCAWELPEAANARIILSSRHGEFSRTLSLLEAIISKSDLSPADFTLSVHHALIGLLSIVQKNHKGHTAIASGSESFCFGLLEAAACLHENPNESVVLIHFDDLLQDSFAEFNNPNEQPIALALALTGVGGNEEFQIDIEPNSSSVPSALHAQDFLKFVSSDARECLSVGENQKWRWTRNAVA